MELLASLVNGVIALIVTAVPLIVLSNWFMAGIKKFMDKAETTMWLRGILVLFSAVAVIISASLTGEAVDYNQVSDLVVTGLTILVTAVGAHLSYKVIKA